MKVNQPGFLLESCNFVGNPYSQQMYRALVATSGRSWAWFLEKKSCRDLKPANYPCALVKVGAGSRYSERRGHGLQHIGRVISSHLRLPMLTVRSIKKPCLGTHERAFSAVAPQSWNNLPRDVCLALSLSDFGRQLKIVLFKIGFSKSVHSPELWFLVYFFMFSMYFILCALMSCHLELCNGRKAANICF